MKAAVVILNRRAYIVEGKELRRLLFRVAGGHLPSSVFGMDLGTAYVLDYMDIIEATDAIDRNLWTDEWERKT